MPDLYRVARCELQRHARPVIAHYLADGASASVVVPVFADEVSVSGSELIHFLFRLSLQGSRCFVDVRSVSELTYAVKNYFTISPTFFSLPSQGTSTYTWEHDHRNEIAGHHQEAGKKVRVAPKGPR